MVRAATTCITPSQAQRPAPASIASFATSCCRTSSQIVDRFPLASARRRNSSPSSPPTSRSVPSPWLREIDPTVFAIVSATPAILGALFAQLPPRLAMPSWTRAGRCAIASPTCSTPKRSSSGACNASSPKRAPSSARLTPRRACATAATSSRLAILAGRVRDAPRRGHRLAGRPVPRQSLDRVGDHDEAGEISVADIAHQWAYHDLMHLKQAESIIQLRLEGGMGNTRLFYFDV